MIRAVFFDLGETLVDESRLWLRTAESMGIPPFTLMGVVGGLAARGEDHRRAFDLLAPGRPVPPWPPIEHRDLYPDAAPCLRQCRAEGWVVGIAGNQPAGVEEAVRALGLDVDVVASSGGWGVEKPSPEFFARVVESTGCTPADVAYLGDRVDNDIVPARAAGLVPVLVRRGPWGRLQSAWPEAAQAVLTVDTLDGLAAALRRLPA